MRKNQGYLIGIDEAGRGPLAGPIVVAGIRIRIPATSNPKSKIPNPKIRKLFQNIKDSKKLSEKQREEWHRLLTNHPKIEWAAAKVWPKTIDRINIARAANLGASRVHKRLSPARCVLLDGGLKLPPRIPHRVVIKGDEKIPVIAAASIIAKVLRDRTMLRLHKKYPQYGFAAHKGYGTKLHRKMIKIYGAAEVHRQSFVKNIKFW